MFLRCLNKCSSFFFTYSWETFGKHLILHIEVHVEWIKYNFLELLQQMRCHTANSVTNTVHVRNYNFNRRRKVIFIFFVHVSRTLCIAYIYIYIRVYIYIYIYCNVVYRSLGNSLGFKWNSGQKGQSEHDLACLEHETSGRDSLANRSEAKKGQWSHKLANRKDEA